MSGTPIAPPTTYGDRLGAAMDELGPFCPGIDPHAALLAQWGLPDTVAGLETFALTCVEAFGGAVAAVKGASSRFSTKSVPAASSWSATSTRRWRAAWSRSKRECRSSTWKRVCAASIATCRRKSTGS